MKPSRRQILRVKRSPHLIAHWRGSRFVIRNYALGTASLADPLVCAVLDLCSEWQTLDALGDALPPALADRLPKLVKRLVDRSLLMRSDQPEDPREPAMRALDPWNPEAGFFHTATKDVRFWPAHESVQQARAQARRAPMPEPIKRYPGARAIGLTIAPALLDRADEVIE